MPHLAKLDRRAVLKGLAGVTLALPRARRDGRRSRRADSAPVLRVYTANGMSLPQREARHRRVELVPDGREGRRVRVRQIDRAAAARSASSSASWAGCIIPNGPKADPHICSDMWLTGAPLHNPKPGTFNSVGLDQVVALHTKQYCRQPSLVLSIDAGTGFLSRTGTISYNLEGRPIPAENNPRRVFDRLFRGDRASLHSRARASCSAASSWSTPWPRAPGRSTSSSASPTASGWIST